MQILLHRRDYETCGPGTVSWSDAHRRGDLEEHLSLESCGRTGGPPRTSFYLLDVALFYAGADDWREEAWSVIRDCQSIDWLVLTKRADRIVDHLPADWGDGFPNVWLGVTVESRSHLRRVELLSRIPAAVRWCLRNRFCNRLISARTWGRSTGSSRAVKRRTKTSVGTWTSIGCVASGTSARPHEFRTSSSSITSAIKSKRTECSTGGSARSGLRPDRASDR